MKSQYNNNYSDQSQQEQTARWTSHFLVTCSKRGKNRFCFSLVEKLAPNSHKPTTKRSNRNRIIRCNSYSKSAPCIRSCMHCMGLITNVWYWTCWTVATSLDFVIDFLIVLIWIIQIKTIRKSIKNKRMQLFGKFSIKHYK